MLFPSDEQRSRANALIDSGLSFEDYCKLQNAMASDVETEAAIRQIESNREDPERFESIA